MAQRNENQPLHECPQCGIDDQELYPLECGCLYCNDCIQQIQIWLENCPICETPFLVRIQDENDILRMLTGMRGEGDNDDDFIMLTSLNYFTMVADRYQQIADQQYDALDLRLRLNGERLEMLGERLQAINQPEFDHNENERQELTEEAQTIVFEMLDDQRLPNIAQMEDATTHKAWIKVDHYSPIESEPFCLSNKRLKSSLSWQGHLADFNQNNHAVSLQVNELPEENQPEDWIIRFLPQNENVLLRVESHLSNRNIEHQTSVGGTIGEFCSKTDLHPKLNADSPYIWIRFRKLFTEN